MYAGSENGGPDSGHTGRRGRETPDDCPKLHYRRSARTGADRGEMSGAFIENLAANGQANRDVVIVEGCGAGHTPYGAGIHRQGVPEGWDAWLVCERPITTTGARQAVSRAKQALPLCELIRV